MVCIIRKQYTFASILLFLFSIFCNQVLCASSFDFGEEFWQDAAKIGITRKDSQFNNPIEREKIPNKKFTSIQQDNIFGTKGDDKSKFISRQKKDGTVSTITKIPESNVNQVKIEPPAAGPVPTSQVKIEPPAAGPVPTSQVKIESPALPAPTNQVKIEPPAPPAPTNQVKIEPPALPAPTNQVKIEPPAPPAPTNQVKIEPPAPPAPTAPTNQVKIEPPASPASTNQVKIEPATSTVKSVVSNVNSSQNTKINKGGKKSDSKSIKKSSAKKIFSKEGDKQENQEDQVPFFASYDDMIENALNPQKLEKRRKVYDYRNVILPPSISKESYSDQNKHLPKVFYMSEYSKLLFIAVENQNIGAIKTLLLRGANINAQDLKNGYTPLMYAVKGNKKLSVQYLIVKGVNLNVRAFDGKTALHIAAITGNFEILKILISNKANIFIRDNDGKTFFDYLGPANKDLISYFFSNYDDINQVLIDSTILGSLLGIEYALNKGADINFKSYLNGDTALIIAARYSYVDIAKFLLENGADFKVQNLYGDNALNIALMQNDIDVASLIETLIFNQELSELGLVKGILKNNKAPLKKTLSKKVIVDKSKDIEKLDKSVDHKHEYSFYNFDLYPSQRFLNSKNKLYLYTEK